MKKQRYSFIIHKSAKSVVNIAIIIVFAISIHDLIGWMFNITFVIL